VIDRISEIKAKLDKLDKHDADNLELLQNQIDILKEWHE